VEVVVILFVHHSSACVCDIVTLPFWHILYLCFKVLSAQYVLLQNAVIYVHIQRIDLRCMDKACLFSYSINANNIYLFI